MPVLLQPSFSRGEISPSLQARVDLASYGTALALAENWIILPEGGITTRPGYQFCGFGKTNVLPYLLDFVVADGVAYAIELGDHYARFWFDGALVRDGGGAIVELATPWPIADAWRVKYTQSVDVMYLAHPDYPPQRIIRTAVNAFTIEEYVNRLGPFKIINSDDSRMLAASASAGLVTITANFDAFAAGMEGMLVKLEVPALGNIKPWVQGDRSVSVGTLRRSDGKVYRAVTVPTGGNWTETGNVRPTHETGRDWDGPADSKISGSYTWYTGVEWEFLHAGYGIAKITTFTDARHVTAQVVVPFPDDVVGGFPTPGNTWNLTGDGVTTGFTLTGAISDVQSQYAVTFNGSPV